MGKTMIKKDFLIIFILALLVRLAGFFLVYSEPIKFYGNSDSYNYENIAINLIQQWKFSGEPQPPFTPDLHRTPVYPLLIAGVYSLTDNSVIILILFQIIINSFTAALMPILVHSLNLASKVGRIAGLILVFDPLIGLTTYLMITETVFISFLIPTIIMLARYFKTRHIFWLAGSAVLLAITSLTRPIAQFLPFVLIPLFFMATNRDQWRFVWKSIVLFLFISLLITYTWAYRNYSVANIWALSTISDQNLLYYRGRDVIAEAEGINEAAASKKLKQLIQSEVEAGHLSSAEEIYLMRSTAFGIFRQYPKITLMVHVKGFVRVMINPGFNLICIMLDLEDASSGGENNARGCLANDSDGFFAQTIDKLGQMGLLEKIVAVWGILLLMGMYLGAAVGVWKLLREKQWSLLYLLLILIAYFSILSAGGESIARFRIPFIPFLAILAGIGVVNPIRDLEKVNLTMQELPKVYDINSQKYRENQLLD